MTDPIIGDDATVIPAPPPATKVAANSGRKAARDAAGFGGAGLMVMTALGEYVEVRKATFALGVLVISGVLSFAYRYARDRGWLLPSGDGA